MFPFFILGVLVLVSWKIITSMYKKTNDALEIKMLLHYDKIEREAFTEDEVLYVEHQRKSMRAAGYKV